MLLPSHDFELTYWRLRRHLLRVRWEYRARVSAFKAQAQLRYMQYFGEMPGQPEPEETFAYRAMWAVCIVMLGGVLLIEATVGPDEFTKRTSAAWEALQGRATRTPPRNVVDMPRVYRIPAARPADAERIRPQT